MTSAVPRGITFEWLSGFAGGAALWALALASVALAVVALSGGARRAGQAAPFALATAFFLALTHYPAPDPATMICPVPSATPNLRPFNFLVTAGELVAWQARPAEWLRNLHLVATVMNFSICLLIGAGLARLTVRLTVAAFFGLGLTLAVEFSQLTAVWGLWPCPWRQFNVDDILLNVAGVIVGFAAIRRWKDA